MGVGGGRMVGGGGGVGWKESRGPPFNYLDPLRKAAGGATTCSRRAREPQG